MNAILNRKSIRKYKDIKVSDEIVEELLKVFNKYFKKVNLIINY